MVLCGAESNIELTIGVKGAFLTKPLSRSDSFANGEIGILDNPLSLDPDLRQVWKMIPPEVLDGSVGCESINTTKVVS